VPLFRQPSQALKAKAKSHRDALSASAWKLSYFRTLIVFEGFAEIDGGECGILFNR